MQFLNFSNDLLRIPLRQPSSSPEPCWINEWLDGLDTFALYGFLATRNPALLLEVGSGYSTKLARRAIRDGNAPVLGGDELLPRQRGHNLEDTLVGDAMGPQLFGDHPLAARVGAHPPG